MRSLQRIWNRNIPFNISKLRQIRLRKDNHILIQEYVDKKFYINNLVVLHGLRNFVSPSLLSINHHANGPNFRFYTRFFLI